MDKLPNREDRLPLSDCTVLDLDEAEATRGSAVIESSNLNRHATVHGRAGRSRGSVAMLGLGLGLGLEA
jgi:hypothetical protein